MLHCLPFNDLQNKWLWFFCPSLSVVLQLLSDRTDMQSVWTFTRNLNLIGATQTLPSSLNVLLFSNAFGLRSVRSSISSRHHAQVVLWIYVLGTCIHHCNIPAVFIFFFFFISLAYDLHGDYFCQFFNYETRIWVHLPYFSCYCCCYRKQTGWTWKWWLTWKIVVGQTSRTSKRDCYVLRPILFWCSSLKNNKKIKKRYSHASSYVWLNLESYDTRLDHVDRFGMAPVGDSSVASPSLTRFEEHFSFLFVASRKGMNTFGPVVYGLLDEWANNLKACGEIEWQQREQQREPSLLEPFCHLFEY